MKSKRITTNLTTLALGLCTFGFPAAAQTVLSGDHSVDGSLCAGVSCTGSESFTGADLKIKVINPELLFEDTSAAGSPTRDWRVLTNENGAENFVIEDVDAGRDVFWIEGAAPANSIYVSQFGRLGLGTSLPVEELHIAGSTSPSIRLETNIDGSAWDIRTNSNYWWVEREPEGNFPFVLASEAPSESFWMVDSGNIGLGTDTAQDALHLTRADGTAKILVEETGGSGAQELFEMRANGGSYFTLSNTTSGRDWFFTHENAAQGRFIITSSTNPADGLFLAPGGDMTIGGTLTTGGGTCGGGCDAVFSDEYDLPSIAQHSQAMYDLGYLPNVGPTPENAPINVSDKLGRMLNELEHAHIYIAQQQDVIDGLGTYVETLNARLAALETQLQD